MESQTKITELPDSMWVHAVHEQATALDKLHLTSFKGYRITNVSYDQLVDILGKPTFPNANSDGTVQKSWVLVWDSKVYEIYDYHTFDEQYTIRFNTFWHIGSHEDANPLDLVELIQNIAKSRKENGTN
ncbi:MAG: hypothetical protein Unbinned6046contig1000_4 [Prokaryotic dsDNA virus sp.]|nr:MAG: hypothetical protein Unbinned6046contig1000_4 [Prokaryotic dsDNA virus sp.]|tara:strand:- start:134 stop:520 length:387 start_codon:yes stop_codon:yes gene_type:complete